MDVEEVGDVAINSNVSSELDPVESEILGASSSSLPGTVVVKPHLHVDLTKKLSAIENQSTCLNSPEEQDIIERVNRSFSRSSSVTISYLTDTIEREMSLYDTEDIVTKVHKPEKVVKPLESFVMFTVCTKTTRDEYSDSQFSVKRRYNDFLWLHTQLSHRHQLHILPPLPEKQNLTLDRFEGLFVSYRETALGRFLSRLCQHPLFSYSKALQAFLTLEPNAFSRYKKTSSESRLANITSYLHTPYHSYKHSIKPSFDHQALYKYAHRFGEKMAAIEKITQRLCQRQSDYVKCLMVYSCTYNQWSSDETELATSLSSMAELYDHIMVGCHELVDTSTLSVSLPLREYYLFSVVVKSTLDRRDFEQYKFEKSLEKIKDQEGTTTKPNTALAASMSTEGRTSVAASLRADSLHADSLRADSLHADSLHADSLHADSLHADSPQSATSDTNQKHKQHSVTKQMSTEDKADDQLEIANAEFDADFQRWNINKKQDLKTCLEGIATRNINYYDSQINCLVSLLRKLKDRKPES